MQEIHLKGSSHLLSLLTISLFILTLFFYYSERRRPYPINPYPRVSIMRVSNRLRNFYFSNNKVDCETVKFNFPLLPKEPRGFIGYWEYCQSKFSITLLFLLFQYVKNILKSKVYYVSMTMVISNCYAAPAAMAAKPSVSKPTSNKTDDGLFNKNKNRNLNSIN